MRIVPSRALLTLALFAGCLSSLHAAVVNVRFIHPEQFSDIGYDNVRRQEVLDALQAYLVGLGQKRLPAEDILTVEILDIDLAGDARPVPGQPQELRILKGSADAPRISLRYTLSARDQVIESGKADLSDLAYLDRMRRDNQDAETFPYEKRLLAEWFDSTFAGKVITQH